MTDGDYLLQSILADPEDDTVRLAYADWLQDQPDEYSRLHSELIQLQIELNREQPEYLLDWSMNPAVYDHSSDARIRRSADLVRRMYWEMHKAADASRDCYRQGSWRRGFLDHCFCMASEWWYFAEAVLRRQPLQRVTLTTYPDWRVDTHIERDSPNLNNRVTFYVNWRGRQARVATYVSDVRVRLSELPPNYLATAWFEQEGAFLALSVLWPRLKPRQWEVKR